MTYLFLLKSGMVGNVAGDCFNKIMLIK